MVSLPRRIQADLAAAMKARDVHKVETLRGLASDLKYRQIELGTNLTDADAVAVLKSAAKRRREALEAFRIGQRPDLAQRENTELEWISAYLPPDMPDSELDGLVAAAIGALPGAGPKDLGRVMAAVMPRLQGRVDGARVRARVEALLAK